MTDPKTAYSLITVVKKPRINPGEDIEIDIYISGEGDIEAAQLFIVHSRPTQEFDSGATVRSNLAPLDEQEFDHQTDVLTGVDAEDSGYISKRSGLQNGAHIPIPPQLFESSGVTVGREIIFPFEIRHTETTYEDRNDEKTLSPFTYTLPTKKSLLPTKESTDAGEYTIHTVITYEAPDGTIHQDKNQSKVTVRNYIEQHSFGLTIARYLLAFLALLSLIVTAISVT